MPHSYDFFKQQVKDWIIQNVPKHKRILDVGPGIGTYSKLIRSHGYRIDAVEIFAPYIEKYDLISQYDNVFVDDICKFESCCALLKRWISSTNNNVPRPFE